MFIFFRFCCFYFRHVIFVWACKVQRLCHQGTARHQVPQPRCICIHPRVTHPSHQLHPHSQRRLHLTHQATPHPHLPRFPITHPRSTWATVTPGLLPTVPTWLASIFAWKILSIPSTTSNWLSLKIIFSKKSIRTSSISLQMIWSKAFQQNRLKHLDSWTIQ